MSAVAIEIRDKLRVLGGPGPLKVQIGNVRERLSKVQPKYWRASQSYGRIKRFLYLEQMPSGDEIMDIRAAYVMAAPDTIRKNRERNAELIKHIVEFANAAGQYDEDFLRASLGGIREALVQAGLDENEVGRIT